jgi:hypothetical protein
VIQDFLGLSLTEAYALFYVSSFLGGMATMYIIVYFVYGENPEQERQSSV